MQTHKAISAALSVGSASPIVIAHTQGSTLTGFLTHELMAAGFRLAIASDAGLVSEQGLDVVIMQRERIDTGAVIDDIRRYFPTTRIVSIVTVGEVVVVHAFASVPPAAEREHLRDLAASVRRAVRSAAAAAGAATRRESAAHVPRH